MLFTAKIFRRLIKSHGLAIVNFILYLYIFSELSSRLVVHRVYRIQPEYQTDI